MVSGTSMNNIKEFIRDDILSQGEFILDVNFWLFISVERQSFIDKILYECNDFKILIRVKIYYFAIIEAISQIRNLVQFSFFIAWRSKI